MKSNFNRHSTPGPDRGGYALIECLVYAFLLVLLTGAALAAFYRCVDGSMGLRRNAADISHALLAGERWRGDIRAASGRIALQSGTEDELLIPVGPGRQISYHFASNAVWRRADRGNWICAITNVRSSVMLADVRPGVEAWRWELELLPRAKHSTRFHPLFTFLAVPERRAAK